MRQLITLVAAAFAAVALFPHATTAAMLFTEDFSSETPGSNMTLGTGHGSPVTSFDNQNFHITSGTGSRIYLGTNDLDYSTINFVFEATVTVPDTSDPWAMAFMGMGTTTPDSGLHGEPSFPGIYTVLSPVHNRALHKNGNFFTGTEWADNLAISNATHRLRMEWDATTEAAIFSIDVGNTGTFGHSSGSIVAADTFDNNSRLFVGGGNGLIFDDISVVPEPASWLLLLSALACGLLVRRRRGK